MVALPREHELARRKGLTLSEVCQEPIIGFPHQFNPVLHDWFFATFAASGCSPRVAIEVTTLVEFLHFVARGHGIALLPRSATSVKVAGVVFRELMDERFAVAVAGAYRPRNESDLMRRFIAFVRKQIDWYS
jgi:DNA-binding transcriptional LysR family regulator